jgi:Domain of unknown function (DUF4132)
MASVIEALEMLASKGWYKEWQSPAWKQFVLSGDEKLLKNLPKFRDHSWLPDELLSALPTPAQIDESGKRFLQACHAAGHPQALGTWIHHHAKENPVGDAFAKGCAVILEFGCPKQFLANQVAEFVRPLRLPDGSPTAAGTFLLSLDDKSAMEVFRKIGQHAGNAPEFTALFVSNAPQRWKVFLEKFNQEGDSKHFDPSAWVLALGADPNFFLEPAARAFELLKNWYARFAVGAKLHEVKPARFEAAMEKLTVGQLLIVDTVAEIRLWNQAQESASWLVIRRGLAALPPLKEYFSAEVDTAAGLQNAQSEYKKQVLDRAVQKFGREALPLLEACFATDQPEVQLRALQLWSSLKAADDTKTLAAKLHQLFASTNSSAVARAVRLAGDLVPEAVENDLWSLLSHKSRPVRDAAASTLAKLGESRLPKAQELWGARRADTRIAAVAWLKAVGTTKAAGALKARLDEEEDDNVRDAILLALEKLEGGATKADPAELRQRIKKTLAKIDGPPASWLDPKKLPAPKLVDGSKLPPDSLLYLLHRQSRVKEMRADIEARPLFAQLDRKTSGELALAVLQAFFGSKADSEDRWAMAFAAMVGDDRLVPIFTRQIKEWADNMRGKLAEYAVQALALLGTDAALLAVDAMAIRYRSKNKNIGKAASEAFADAAQARGLTVEELGDLVVPWLGFEAGKPRVVEAGKTKIEARINNDFKLAFRDTTTGKKVAKLPEGATADVKNEFKELSAGLKEAVKSQLLRMETLMVRQFRWPVARWRELYLQHPLLLRFAERLVWGAYDKNGKLAGTFRALEDHSLTDAADEAYDLPNDGAIGIVHPLELKAEARQAWLRHLADYHVIPPFAQLERSVVTVKQDQKETKFGTEIAGTALNAMTFKGRAERLGWTRGSVCDAGCINYYMKSFPTAGVDVFLETEGMYVGIDMYSEIKLGKVFFVKHASVQIGSYVYDEPGDADDARVVSYGDVPGIAFSEAVGDLVRISGKSEAQQPEAADA